MFHSGPASEAVPGGSDLSVNMNTSRVFAIVLMAVGFLALAYQGFTYTTREKVVDIGPVHVTTERSKTLPLPPIVGVVAVGTGLALMFLSRKKG